MRYPNPIISRASDTFYDNFIFKPFSSKKLTNDKKSNKIKSRILTLFYLMKKSFYIKHVKPNTLKIKILIVH